MENENKEKPKTKNKLAGRILLGAALLIGLIYGFIKYREGQRYESTDDAQLESDISPVSARVQGYVLKVYFNDNQLVKKGDTLITLDDRDLKIKVDQAQASLDNAKASLDVAKSNVTVTQVGGTTGNFRIDELKIRVANAQKEFERYKKMLAEGSTTDQQFEKIKTDKEALEKQLDAAQQHLKESESRPGSANEQVKVAESLVKQRQSDLDYAKLQLSYATIIAPYDGIVSKKNAITGQLVQAGQSLCALIANQDIWVVANFKETQIQKMKEGMKVEVEVDAFPGKKIEGKINSFSSATGAKFSLIPPDNATGNFVKVVQRIPVKIELDRNNEVYKDLKPGMSVFLRVVLEE